MIISKAIEILTTSYHYHFINLPPDEKDAIKLGHEALKRIQQGRLHPFNPMYTPLTGETMPDRGIQAVMQSRQSKKPKRA